MKVLPFIVLLNVLNISFGQRYNEQRIAGDFNTDSFVDPIIRYYSGGSGLGASIAASLTYIQL